MHQNSNHIHNFLIFIIILFGMAHAKSDWLRAKMLFFFKNIVWNKNE
jgi:hypothetical protein